MATEHFPQICRNNCTTTIQIGVVQQWSHAAIGLLQIIILEDTMGTLMHLFEICWRGHLLPDLRLAIVKVLH